jgi:hypothetical protein
MLTTESLHALQMNSLPDINDVEPLSVKDETCLAEVRSVLEKHHRLSRFGIVLLHKHFAVGEEELLVETCDFENRTLYTKPVNRKDVNMARLTETIWRFDTGPGEPDRGCVLVCPLDAQGNRHNGYKEHS